jgi:hypothetical protein
MLRDTPRLPAMTVVAPAVRFNALAILVTPCLSLAIVFNVRTSSFDHARRTTFFFLANFHSLFLGTGLVAREDDLARQPIRSGIRQAFFAGFIAARLAELYNRLSFPARKVFCYHGSPSCIMLLVEFEPTPFAAGYWHTIRPRNVAAGIVQWCKIIERFEFESFFN